MRGGKVVAFAIGPVLAAGLGAVTVPLLAWLFDPADVGRFGVLQTTQALIVTGVLLGLDQAYVREYHEVRDRRTLFWTTTPLPYAVLAVITVVALLFAGDIARALYGEAESWWTLGTLACVWVALLLRQWTLVVRMQERGLVFSVVQSLPRAVLVVLALGLTALSRRPDFSALQAIFLLSSLVCLIALGAVTARTWFPPSRGLGSAFLRRLLRYGVPLSLAALLYTGLASAGVYALRIFWTLDEVAVFAVAVSAAGVAVVVQTIFSVVWAPILYRNAAAGSDRPLVAAAQGSVLAVVCAAYAACGMLSWLLDYLLPADYGQVRLLVLVMIAQPLLYVLSEVTGSGLGVTRRSGFALAASVVAIVACIGLNLALTPFLGAVGAGLAAMFAFWVLFVLKTEFSARVWGGLPRRRLHGLVVVAVALAATTLLSATDVATTTALWAAFGVASALLCRREWATIAQRIRGRSSRTEES